MSWCHNVAVKARSFVQVKGVKKNMHPIDKSGVREVCWAWACGVGVGVREDPVPSWQKRASLHPFLCIIGIANQNGQADLRTIVETRNPVLIF